MTTQHCYLLVVWSNTCQSGETSDMEMVKTSQQGTQNKKSSVLFLFIFFRFHFLFPPLDLSLSFRCKFFSLTETPEDYTIIVDAEGFKGGPLLVSASSQSPWQPIGLRNLWFPPAPMFEHTLSLWFVVG